MPSAGILILLTLLGTWACVKGRAAGPAAAGAALAVLFMVSTPVGSGLPGMVSGLFSLLDGVTTPVLNHEAPVATADDAGPGARPVGTER